VIEYERDTPKLNVWLGLHKHGVISPFFFMESTVTGHSYLDMLENFAVPQIPPGFIFQQDGAPPHFHRDVTTFLDETFPPRWVGRGGPTAWPPRSPDLTPLDFFAWEFINPSVWSDEHCSSWRKHHLSWSDEHCSSWCMLSLIRLYLNNIGSKCNRGASCLFVKELALLWCGRQLLEIISSFFSLLSNFGFSFCSP